MGTVVHLLLLIKEKKKRKTNKQTNIRIKAFLPVLSAGLKLARATI